MHNISFLCSWTSTHMFLQSGAEQICGQAYSLNQYSDVWSLIFGIQILLEVFAYLRHKWNKFRVKNGQRNYEIACEDLHSAIPLRSKSEKRDFGFMKQIRRNHLNKFPDQIKESLLKRCMLMKRLWSHLDILTCKIKKQHKSWYAN